MLLLIRLAEAQWGLACRVGVQMRWLWRVQRVYLDLRLWVGLIEMVEGGAVEVVWTLLQRRIGRGHLDRVRPSRCIVECVRTPTIKIVKIGVRVVVHGGFCSMCTRGRCYRRRGSL
jgi:hypothetical protein